MYMNSRRKNNGLGIAPVVATAAPTVFKIATDIFGGQRPRAGGADPCIIGFAPGETVANAGQNGAPPDYRNLPVNLKDDAADCIPIPWGGKMWVIDPSTHRWVVVNGAAVPMVPGIPPAPPPVYPTAPNGVTIAPNGAQPQPANGIAKLLPIGIAAAIALMAS